MLVGVGTTVQMYKAQISDDEQIECEEYEVGDNGIELYDESGDCIAFVPFAHLLYVGTLTDDGQIVRESGSHPIERVRERRGDPRRPGNLFESTVPFSLDTRVQRGRPAFSEYFHKSADYYGEAPKEAGRLRL
jgi:hypothetical protein